MQSSLTTLEHPQIVGMVKGDTNADHDCPLVSKVKCAKFIKICAKFHQDRNVGQHRLLQLVQYFIFLISRTTACTFQQLVKVSLQSDEQIKIGMQGDTRYSLMDYPNLVHTHLQQLVGVGKGNGHVESDIPLVSKVKCAKFHQHICKISSRSECRAIPGIPASQILIFMYIKSCKPKISCNFKFFNINYITMYRVIYIRRGNRRLSLVALPGLPAASRSVKLPLLANTRSVFQFSFQVIVTRIDVQQWQKKPDRRNKQSPRNESLRMPHLHSQDSEYSIEICVVSTADVANFECQQKISW